MGDQFALDASKSDGTVPSVPDLSRRCSACKTQLSRENSRQFARDLGPSMADVAPELADKPIKPIARMSLESKPGHFIVNVPVMSSVSGAGGKDLPQVQLTSPLERESPIQANLAIIQPGDALEQEADSIAEKVMARTPSLPQREKAQLIQMQRSSSQAAFSSVPPIVNEVLRSPGLPLDEATREFMEPRFGCDFGQVRIHQDEHAMQSAYELGAFAYTLGNDIVLGSGQHHPQMPDGMKLLAHELAHVVQQSDASKSLGNAQIQRLRDQTHDIAFDITGIFEGGKPDSLQTVDMGIISYGKHQATLSSGSLYEVLKLFAETSQTPTSIQLATYLDRVKSKDGALRSDAMFLKLLKDAAREDAMNQAQDDVFSKMYYEPAKEAAIKDGVTSALGIAIYYDTNIQGGLATVRTRTRQHFSALQDAPTEQEWLRFFLGERSNYLTKVAASQRTKAIELRNKGNEGKAHTLETNASMLESAARGRVGVFQNLVNSGNLDLKQGDANQQIAIGRDKVFAVDSVYRQMVDLISPEVASGAKPDFAQAFKILNGLNMAQLLAALAGLQQRGYLLMLMMNFSYAPKGGAWAARTQAAIQAVLVKGKMDSDAFDKKILSSVWPESAQYPDQRETILRYIGRSRKELNSDTLAVSTNLLRDPLSGNINNYSEIFRELNPLSMDRMLKTFTELKSIKMLDMIERNFDQAKNIGVFEDRIWVAIEAVQQKGRISWEDFEQTVLNIKLPTFQTVETDQRDLILRYLGKPIARPKRERKGQKA
jgi:hypothetical protein